MGNTAMPRVSIMIPTYNQSLFIEQAIRSALAQDYAELEVVVSDDASTDDTFEKACAISDPRLRCIRNDTNLGRVGNYRHTLYDLAHGEWVLNLDGDDYLTDPQFISAAVEAAQAHPKIVMVGGGNYYSQGGRGEAWRPVDAPTRMAGLDLLVRWRQHCFTHLATLYNRHLAMEIGFYDCDIISSDQESLFRLMLRGDVALLDRLAGVWRLHGGNTSRNASFTAALENRACYLNVAREARALGYDAAIVGRWERSMAGYWALDAVNTWCLALSTQTCRESSSVLESLTRMRDMLCSSGYAYELAGTAAMKLFLFKLVGVRPYLMIYRSFRSLLRRQRNLSLQGEA